MLIYVVQVAQYHLTLSEAKATWVHRSTRQSGHNFCKVPSHRCRKASNQHRSSSKLGVKTCKICADQCRLEPLELFQIWKSSVSKNGLDQTRIIHSKLLLIPRLNTATWGKIRWKQPLIAMRRPWFKIKTIGPEITLEWIMKFHKASASNLTTKW